MSDIHEALLLCHTIQRIFFQLPPRLCLGKPDWFALSLNPPGGDRYLSAPKVLSLDECGVEGYGLVSAPKTNLRTRMYWLYSVVSPWRPERKSNFELWLDAMNLSQVHMLHLSSTMVLSLKSKQLLSAELPSLHTLIIDDGAS
jgi:hypothetical protein